LYLICFIQHPSMFATTLSAGTCFGRVQPSCSSSPGVYRYITPSSRKRGLPSHD